MIRPRSRVLVALVFGALSSALLTFPPQQAHAQKSQTKKAPARKKAPAKKPAAPRTQPTTTTTTPPPAAAQPPAEKAEEQSPAAKKTEEEAEEAKPAAKAEEPEKADETSKEAAGPHLVTLDLAVGMRAFQRHLSYSSDNTPSGMRPYDIDPGAAAFGAAAELYPGASATTGFGGNIGITAAFQRAIGLTSKYKDPVGGQEESYSTTSYGFDFGLKYRVPFSSSEIGFALAYGQQTFSVSLPSTVPSNVAVPAVEYRYIRPGLSARFGVAEGFAIFGGLGYLWVPFNVGEINSSTFFPHASVGGAEVGFGVAIELVKRLEIRPSFDYRAYFFSMNYQTGETSPNVGGAFDQYLGLNLALAYRN